MKWHIFDSCVTTVLSQFFFGDFKSLSPITWFVLSDITYISVMLGHWPGRYIYIQINDPMWKIVYIFIREWFEFHV